jgi:circadian clock protein KaiA
VTVPFFLDPQANDPQTHEQLFVCALIGNERVANDVAQQLRDARYSLILSRNQSDFLTAVQRNRQKIDCLMLYDDVMLPNIIEWLHEHATLLPTVIVHPPLNFAITPRAAPETLSAAELELTYLYHTAEVRLLATELEKLKPTIDGAIAEFLKLFVAPPDVISSDDPQEVSGDLTTMQNFVLLQQRRLADKLKERLGYLGVYYKRNPSNFLRAMPAEEAEGFLNELKASYQDVILGYFNDDDRINQKIDAFVDLAFFADLSVAKVVEIHMDLIGDFSKQLKLEGRSEEILTDYRLTLIDTLAHLCEMYRRSIPRELPDS